MNKKLKSKKVNTNKGITLIALIITIIVLLILAAVTIRAVTGGDGIISKARQAQISYDNAQVNEALQTEVLSYWIKKTDENTTTSVIAYLKLEEVGIINENYVINVEKLVGQKLSTGNGTFESMKDIYVLEQQEAGETANVARLASTKIVKIAQTDGSDEIIYDLVYYDKNGEKNVIGKLSDTVAERKTITFTIDGETYQTKEGTTWYEFCQKHTDEFQCYGLESSVFPLGSSKTYLRRKKDKSDVNGSDVIEHEEQFYWFDSSAACVKGDTEILTNLNETKYAKDISNGDSIMYYNYETNQLEVGTVSKVYIHKDATDFVKYTFEDGSYLEVTDYHPIYTTEGWKSLTRRNGYEKPEVGDKVKTQDGWKTLSKIEEYTGLEDCYDFGIKSKDGKTINNYFANGTLVQSSIN